MSIKDLLRSSIRKSGFLIRRFPTPLDQCYSRNAILQHLKIDVVLDVGGNVGDYGAELRDRGFSGRIVSFEPVSTTFAKLKAKAAFDGKWTVKQIALGSQDGQTTINVADTMSSILPKHADSDQAMQFDYKGTETVQLSRLNTVWPELVQPGERVFLKLDVQGFEMHVLDGAAARLADVQGIEVELSLTPIYAGQPSFDVMYQRLRDTGFSLRQVWSHGVNASTGSMADFDAIFQRTSS